jgi:hypothetical protein
VGIFPLFKLNSEMYQKLFLSLYLWSSSGLCFAVSPKEDSHTSVMISKIDKNSRLISIPQYINNPALLNVENLTRNGLINSGALYCNEFPERLNCVYKGRNPKDAVIEVGHVELSKSTEGKAIGGIAVWNIKDKNYCIRGEAITNLLGTAATEGAPGIPGFYRSDVPPPDAPNILVYQNETKWGLRKRVMAYTYDGCVRQLELTTYSQ